MNEDLTARCRFSEIFLEDYSKKNVALSPACFHALLNQTTQTRLSASINAHPHIAIEPHRHALELPLMRARTHADARAYMLTRACTRVSARAATHNTASPQQV